MARRSLVAVWWLLYAAFVVYGSLVPLEFRPLPPGEAWARFQQIPFLNLGVGSRADWIANGVLYAPLGFLGTLALLQRGWWRIAACVPPVAFAWALAVAVEYTQLYFPPRTVSLNDLLAEAIGSVVGAGAALAAWSWRARWRPLRQAGSHWLHEHALTLYAAAYLAYSLFPYDVLISGAELADKLASEHWGWWLAGADGRPLLALVRLVIECLLAAPLGAWLAARRAPGGSSGPSRPVGPSAPTGSDHPARGHRAVAGGLGATVLAGLAIGLAVELAQLLIASGISQGASVLARAAGVVLGASLWARRADWGPQRLRAAVLRAAPWILPAYLGVLLGVNGWFSHAWGGLDDAADTLAGVRWQPFYYHYYTSEAQALLSLTSVAFSYAPLGLWAWARRSPALAAALSALALCALVETGKLFLDGLRPDPTNLGIAALAAAVVVWAARRWRHTLRAARTADAQPFVPDGGSGANTAAGHAPRRHGQAAPVDPTATATAAPRFGSPGLWLLAAAALAWQVASAPPLALFSTLAVLAVAASVAWRPALAPVWLMAALPLWDLAPWTGRALWDEFDLLLALVLAVAWARTPRPVVARPPMWRLGFALLALSLVLSAVIGFWPGAPPDANALAGYHGPYNTLRIAKGLLWAALLVGLWRRLDAAGHDVPALFARGLLIGLAGVVAWVLWERWAFVGFADLAADYRVTGPFAAMHRGGAFVECFIAVAMPVAAQAVLSARALAARAASAVLLLAGSVALMLTFSRNGYAALALALLVWALLAVAALRSAGSQGRPAGRGPTPAMAALAALVLLAGVAAAAWPLLRGDYAQQRLARWQQDLQVRVAHWQDALALRDGGWDEALFGVGLGRFPDLHYWRSREAARAARLRIENEGADARSEAAAADAGVTAAAVDAAAAGPQAAPVRYLRLGGGALTYLDQIVSVAGLERATLSLRLRARAANQPLTVSLCEKWMLTSANCVSSTFSADARPGAWTTAEATLDLTPLAASPVWRPVKLALHAPSGDVLIDVADLSLTGADGRERLVNGDFASGFDGWWMSTDIDPPYHVHSLPVAVLLEQGWFGVVAWALLLTLALAAGVAAAWGGSAAGSVAVASLAAFGVSASLNTLVDEPRFLLLLLGLLWAAIAAHAARWPAPLPRPAGAPRRHRSRAPAGPVDAAAGPAR